MDTIGTRIQERREKLGMSTRKLAGEVGISNAAITKLEKDQSKAPSADNLFKLARALDTDPQFILYGERRYRFVGESTPQAGKTAWPLSTPREDIESLDPHDRDQLDRIVDAFVSGCKVQVHRSPAKQATARKAG